MEKLHEVLFGFDEYDLKARIYPGLLVLLPFMVSILSVFIIIGKLNWLYALISSFVFILILKASLNTLKDFMAGKGSEIQNYLWESWGGNPLYNSLKWDNLSLMTNSQRTKIYKILKNKFNIIINKNSVDATRRIAGDNILNYVRENDPNGIWKKQLIEYGSSRNLLGSRNIAIIINILNLSIDLYLWKHLRLNLMQYTLYINILILFVTLYIGWISLPKNVKCRSEQYSKSIINQFNIIIAKE